MTRQGEFLHWIECPERRWSSTFMTSVRAIYKVIIRETDAERHIYSVQVLSRTGHVHLSGRCISFGRARALSEHARKIYGG